MWSEQRRCRLILRLECHSKRWDWEEYRGSNWYWGQWFFTITMEENIFLISVLWSSLDCGYSWEREEGRILRIRSNQCYRPYDGLQIRRTAHIVTLICFRHSHHHNERANDVPLTIQILHTILSNITVYEILFLFSVVYSVQTTFHSVDKNFCSIPLVLIRQRMMTMSEKVVVDLYFDVLSPYAYIMFQVNFHYFYFLK